MILGVIYSRKYKLNIVIAGLWVIGDRMKVLQRGTRKLLADEWAHYLHSGDKFGYAETYQVHFKHVQYIICQLYLNKEKKSIGFSIARTWIQIPPSNFSSRVTDGGILGKSLNLSEPQHHHL